MARPAADRPPHEPPAPERPEAAKPDWGLVARQTAHRPFAPPAAPWLMTMSWRDLAFIHQEVEVEALRAVVPAALPLDLFEGQAFLGVVPFRMEHVTARFLPELPRVSAFNELNVRTYVRLGERPGVYFFSLDADEPLAVWGARTLFHLPYRRAVIGCSREGDDVVYRCSREDRRAPPGRFAATYGPAGPVRRAAAGTLEHFLTERYCQYTVDDAGNPLRGHIQHPPWPLQDGRCAVEEDTIVPVPLARSGPPLVHFARALDVVAWPMERVPRAERGR
jgi:uncharacterized protein